MESLIEDGSTQKIRLRFQRSPKGLLITVWATKHVEEFMRGLGEGTEMVVGAGGGGGNGRQWVSANKGGGPLKVWSANQAQVNEIMGSGRYRFDFPGYPMDLGREGINSMNLSFLRLVGISNEDGVSFTCSGTAVSLEGLSLLKGQIGRAIKEFYTDYVRPVDMNVYLVEKG